MSTLTTHQKNDIDKLWTEFWTGGIANPLTVIEQISFLMFARLLDVMETTGERRAERTKKPFDGRFSGKDDVRRWKNFKQKDAGEMLRIIRDEVFPHFRKLNGGTTFSEYMQDAQLMVQKPSLLVSAVNMIDKLPITEGDAKGDLYEYLLSKLTTAGINGQFRTPRHIIRFMVELLEPKPTETIGDPACGTAGFLVGAMQYLLENHTSARGKLKGENGETIYSGDLLEPYRDHIQGGMFHGFDFDATMLRIASMNLMLHGVDNPDIHYQDTLSNSFPEHFGRQATAGFDVILANPPFKGSLDEGDVHPTLTQAVKTKKTELLFLALILRMLRKGGRSATIVPDELLTTLQIYPRLPPLPVKTLSWPAARRDQPTARSNRTQTSVEVKEEDHAGVERGTALRTNLKPGLGLDREQDVRVRANGAVVEVCDVRRLRANDECVRDRLR